jgi:hypothetical protein
MRSVRALVATAPFALWSANVGGPQAQPPVIVSFAINDNARAVRRGQPLLLSHRTVGARPTHYRVSPRADFAGAPWLSYDQQPKWQGALEPGTPCVGRTAGVALKLFLQVRIELGQEVKIRDGQRALVPAAIDSNVQVDSICVAT